MESEASIHKKKQNYDIENANFNITIPWDGQIGGLLGIGGGQLAAN